MTTILSIKKIQINIIIINAPLHLHIAVKIAKISISNMTGFMSAILLSVNQTTVGNDLTGATLTRIRTLVKFIDAANFSSGTNATADPTAEFPREVYFVDRKSTENRELVEFELAAPTDLVGMKIPKRQCTRKLFPSIGTFAT